MNFFPTIVEVTLLYIPVFSNKLNKRGFVSTYRKSSEENTDKELISIKTKINYPFIYFLIEPDMVFVYQIKTNNYVTVTDFSEYESGALYEIKNQVEFGTFNHKDYQEVEGKGFFLNQDDMNKIVEVINKIIQEHRHVKGLGNQSGEVHIVTSESAAGTLRVGLERPKTVIGFPGTFSIGPLWKLDEKIGQSYRNEWLFENINFELEDYEYENKITNTLREIEDIADDVPIYIWYGDNADEQTSLRFFLYLLRDRTNEIYLINSTEHYEKNLGTVEKLPIYHTAQMEPKNVKLIFANYKENKQLSNNRRIQLHKEWEELSRTKEVLRLWVDDDIKSAPENYYDSIILETIEKMHLEQGAKDFIKTGSVIGEMITQLDTPVDIFFLEYRIRNLIYNGALELKGIPKSMRHYSVKLR